MYAVVHSNLIYYFANFVAQGGPGCSSFDGAMMEVGPWRWDSKTDHDFFVQEGGWEEYTTVVFSAYLLILPKCSRLMHICS